MLVPKDSILIIPGIGNINALSNYIKSTIGINALKNHITNNNINIIGICLGFQFLTISSEEDLDAECLQLINYKVEMLYKSKKTSVGWKKLIQSDKLNKLTSIENKINESIVYFSHSYGVINYNVNNIGNFHFYYETDLGDKILGAYISKNYIGLQFHPEKSGQRGIEILRECIKHFYCNERKI